MLTQLVTNCFGSTFHFGFSAGFVFCHDGRVTAQVVFADSVDVCDDHVYMCFASRFEVFEDTTVHAMVVTICYRSS